jgi:sugar lactone lactonase YvrE
VDTQGNVLFTWGTAGTGNGQFSSPGGVAAGTNLRIYVADTGNDRIQVFSLGGVWLQTFGGTGSLPGQFDEPRGLAIVPTGVYAGALAVADAGNDRVQIVSPTGSPLDVVGAGQLEAPAAVSAYGGDLYVADTGHDRVVRFNAAGQIDGVWQGTQAPGCFEAPSGVLANEYGLFVADPAHDKIHRFSRAGPLLETWGSTGSDPNQMRGPAGLAMEVGNLWVAEETGNRLQRFHPFVSAAPPVPCGSDPFQCLPS